MSNKNSQNGDSEKNILFCNITKLNLQNEFINMFLTYYMKETLAAVPSTREHETGDI